MKKTAVFLLALGLSVPVIAQQQQPDQTPNAVSRPAQTTSTDDQDSKDRGAGQDVKDAGHSAKRATKKTYHKSKRGVKKGVNKGAEKTGDAADKVQDKTENKDQ